MTTGIACNNPGNIRISNDAWLGKITPSKDASFETFDTMQHGIRAMAIILINYFVRHQCDTITKIVNRYAPPSDNNPVGNYIECVADRTGFEPDAKLDLTTADDLVPLLKAMCDFEQGPAISQVTDQQFEAGVNDALLALNIST